MLKTIIRLGGIIPGYSFRSGRTTLYGGKPLICATEMPIYSFSKYVRDRNKSDKVSAYGIAFLKNEFFDAGGRQVIYGLSTKDIKYIENSPCKRILHPSILPLTEQYRYVSYSPSGDKWIDWSHEREWRWVFDNCPKDIYHICTSSQLDHFEPVENLPLFIGKSDNGFFSSIGIIVWDDNEAKEIQKMLTGFHLAGCNNYSTPFSAEIIKNSFIIILNKVIESVEKGKILEAQTIEGLSNEKIIEPIIIHNYKCELDLLIKNAIEKSKIAGILASKEYKKKYNLHVGACGFANIISYEITDPIIQQLLKMEIASGPYDGEAVIYIEGEWETAQDIDYNEYIGKKICEVLNRELKNIFNIKSQFD